jgi:TolA-binding protein
VRHLFVAVTLLVAAGCVTTDPEARRALADAETRTAQGDYPAALAAYDAYLARYPDGDGASRARAARATVQELLAVRGERDRVAARAAELTREVALARDEAALAREEAALAREAAAARENAARDAASREAEAARQLAARDAELAKLRQEVAQRQAEVARLREDLEAVKRSDLQMERRRR